MSRAVLKVVESPLDGAREDLRLAIMEVEQAEVVAAKGQAEVDKASAHLRAMKLAHGRAEDSLSEVTRPPRTLQDKLREAFDVDDQMRIAEEHYNAPPLAPVTASDLAKLRAAVQSTGDEVIAAQSALEMAQHRAGPAASVLNRAKDRRQRAVSEVVRPQVTRLVAECQGIIELLLAKRAELNLVSSSLVDSYADERRRAFNFLNCMLAFPRRGGLRTEDDLTKRNAALAAVDAVRGSDHAGRERRNPHDLTEPCRVLLPWARDVRAPRHFLFRCV